MQGSSIEAFSSEQMPSNLLTSYHPVSKLQLRGNPSIHWWRQSSRHARGPITDLALSKRQHQGSLNYKTINQLELKKKGDLFTYFAVILLAQERAASTTLASLGIISLTRPCSFASEAVKKRPVKTMSEATW